MWGGQRRKLRKLAKRKRLECFAKKKKKIICILFGAKSLDFMTLETSKSYIEKQFLFQLVKLDPNQNSKNFFDWKLEWNNLQYSQGLQIIQEM